MGTTTVVHIQQGAEATTLSQPDAREGPPSTSVYILLVLLIVPVVGFVVVLVRCLRSLRYRELARKLKLWDNRKPTDTNTTAPGNYRVSEKLEQSALVKGNSIPQVVDAELNEEFDPIYEELEKQLRRRQQRRFSAHHQSEHMNGEFGIHDIRCNNDGKDIDSIADSVDVEPGGEMDQCRRASVESFHAAGYQPAETEGAAAGGPQNTKYWACSATTTLAWLKTLAGEDSSSDCHFNALEGDSVGGEAVCRIDMTCNATNGASAGPSSTCTEGRCTGKPSPHQQVKDRIDSTRSKIHHSCGSGPAAMTVSVQAGTYGDTVTEASCKIYEPEGSLFGSKMSEVSFEVEIEKESYSHD
uniref:Uncharacterized protein n=1 Tax=Trypanosoma vivax (strain Y486) TaxID=1055687 RepID=G0TY69_TRYVY|nr:conserved hypothetical protein [Trypanosoma vivax Y486]